VGVLGVGESGKTMFMGASTRECLVPKKLTRRLFVFDKKIFLNQWLGGLVRCMMTSTEFLGMMRPLHQKNLSPEEREETRTRHMQVWRV
jgi:hypothetical protein